MDGGEFFSGIADNSNTGVAAARLDPGASLAPAAAQIEDVLVEARDAMILIGLPAACLQSICAASCPAATVP